MSDRENVGRWLDDLLADGQASVTSLCGKYVLAYDTQLQAGVVCELLGDIRHVTMPISFPSFARLLVDRGCRLPEGEVGFRWAHHCCAGATAGMRQH